MSSKRAQNKSKPSLTHKAVLNALVMGPEDSDMIYP